VAQPAAPRWTYCDSSLARIGVRSRATRHDDSQLLNQAFGTTLSRTVLKVSAALVECAARHLAELLKRPTFGMIRRPIRGRR
jgi:hypothetical protein